MPRSSASTRSILFAALALATVALTACRGSREAKTGARAPARTSARLLADIDRVLYRPQTAELKGDLYVDAASVGNLKLATVIRTEADSALWLTVRKFGFEGARALVTRDSLWALNRLEREYVAAGAGDIPAGIRELLPVAPTLANLQAAFGGQPIGDWSDARVERDAGGGYALTLPADARVRLSVRGGTQPTPVRWRYADGDAYGEVVFGDFREVPGTGGRVFPYERRVSFSDTPGDTTRVRLALSSLEAHATLRFPISIPRGYRPMDL